MPYCFELLAIIGEKKYHFNFGFIIVIGERLQWMVYNEQFYCLISS